MPTVYEGLGLNSETLWTVFFLPLYRLSRFRQHRDDDGHVLQGLPARPRQ
jgi:hypothetical protein